MLATIPPPPFDALDLGPLSIRLYGLLVIGGGFVLYLLGSRRWARTDVDIETAERLGLILFASIVLGTRVGYVLTHLDRYRSRPWAVLFIWEGGLAIFGGITAAIVVGSLLARRRGFDVRNLGDAMAPAAPLGQAIGRWGNYFNQELFGTPTEVPWALEVEPAHRPPEYAEYETFHPTFLYESVYNLLLASALFWIERRGWLKARGSLCLAYLAGYSFGRFWIELIRTDTTFRFLGLSRNNWVALAFLAGASGLLVLNERRAARTGRT